MAQEQNNIIANNSNKNIWLAIALAVITSLTPEEVSRGLTIINIINGDGSNQSTNSTSSSSQKSTTAIEFISHLNRDLIVKTRSSKKD